MPEWPRELLEAGPPEDPFILLSGSTRIGAAPHKIVAIRIDPTTLAIDYRLNLGDDIYDAYLLEEMVEEMTFLEDIDQSVLVPNERGQYLIWMFPSRNSEEA
jgi:hypothetical protein